MTALCQCGCGTPAPLAPQTSRRSGWVKGRPMQFVRGHNGRADLAGRFWAKVLGGDVDTCWLWTGGTTTGGYGVIWLNGTNALAHRIAWTLLRGDIPDRLTIDHLCCTPACVNPWHFDLVPGAENTRRSHARGNHTKTTQLASVSA